MSVVFAWSWFKDFKTVLSYTLVSGIEKRHWLLELLLTSGLLEQRSLSEDQFGEVVEAVVENNSSSFSHLVC